MRDERCPCCEETQECTDDCTFALDAPEQHEQMMASRLICSQAAEIARLRGLLDEYEKLAHYIYRRLSPVPVEDINASLAALKAKAKERG